jgi:hypothetical protein
VQILLRRGVALEDYEPLEQLDFVAFEKKEVLLRYIEQSTMVYATARDPKQASALVERLRMEYFPEYISQKNTKLDKQTQELLDMQNSTYLMTSAGKGGLLEIRPKT